LKTVGGNVKLSTLLVGVTASLALGFSVASSQPAPVPDESIPLRDNAPAAETLKDSGPLITGPKAKAATDIQVASTVKQGEVLKVRITEPASGAQKAGTAALAGHKANFFEQKDGSLLALIPVSVFQKPGSYPLSIYDSGKGLLKTLNVTVQNGWYRTQNVSVSKTTAGLQPLPGEMEAIQALKDTVTPVKFWSEPFMSPTVDCQNSPFGVKRLHNGVATGDYHKGVDLRSPSGRPIHAISDGKVQISKMYRLHGGTVGLDHGQGVGSIYIHMSRLNVQPGDTVKKGDVIGYVGSTGFASGPHLHWGLYVSGMPVNPNQWIKGVAKCN